MDDPKATAVVVFVSRASHCFRSEPEKLAKVLKILKDSQSGSLETHVFHDQIKYLFDSNPELLLDLSIFLSEDIGEVEKDVVQSALEFSNSIVTQLGLTVFEEVANLTNMQRQGEKNFTDFSREIIHLFNGHQDLIDQFDRFSYGNQIMAQLHHQRNKRKRVRNWRYDQMMAELNRENPSYFRKHTAPSTRQCKIGKQVLNHVFKSKVTMNSPEKDMHNSQTSMDEWEDKMYEMDMLIESTIKTRNNIVKFIKNPDKYSLTDQDLEHIATTYHMYARREVGLTGSLPPGDLPRIKLHVEAEIRKLEIRRDELKSDIKAKKQELEKEMITDLFRCVKKLRI